MDSWRCCGISLKILILLVLQNLNLSVTVCDTADGIFTNFASGEDLGTINRNHEPYSSTNHVESSQTTTCNNLRNIHDNRLISSRSVYSFDIPENVMPGTKVGLVTASAPNQGVDDKVYAIQEDDGNGLFVINPVTGNFTLTRSLDFESAKYYILTVKVLSTDEQFNLIRAYFNVLDINDNPPVFHPDSYSINIMENVPIGTSILTLNITDADEGPNAALTFKIISGDLNGQFAVDRNAVVTVEKKLNREHQSVYALIVQAVDQAQCDSTRFTSSAWITVTLNDVNDNTPEFRTVNTIYIPEDTSIGSVIMTVSAVDLDSGLNGQIEYSLQELTRNKFSINTTSGELSIIGDLDRELVERIMIDVIASDKGEPPLSSSISITIIITDVNDNSPSFMENIYTVTVDENIPRGSDLLIVSATDSDEGKNGQVRYVISSKDFCIDSVTGLISVSGKLDREKTPWYSFVVLALDDGKSPKSGTATVNVILRDFNDFAPIIQPMQVTFHLMENTSTVPQIVHQVLGRDDDLGSNSKLTYQINLGNEDGKFSISANGSLSLVQSLDREIRAEYMLVVTATDAGDPPLTGSGTIRIIVDDLNDNTPLFDQRQCSVTVSEAAPIGFKVLTVHAVDPDAGGNGQVSYSMDFGESPFSIDPISGEIVTTSTLDREIQTSYTLIVLATDKNHMEPLSSSTLVLVIVEDVNDEPPEFLNDPYVANVPAILNEENALNGTIVGCVTATDCDLGFDGIVNYLLIGKSKDRGFQIDMNTGEVVVSGNMKQNRGSHVLLQVLAKNIGSISGFDVDEALINITILEDSNALIFKSAIYQTHVREDSLVGTSVISLMADNSGTIPEWKQFEIQIKDGNKNNSFSVNSQTGEVFIASSLDRETTPFYNLTITAFGRGTSPATGNAQLMIIVDDVNDNGPILVNTEGYIMENQPPGTQLIYLNATDLDSLPNQGPFRYQLADNSNASSFVTLSPAGVLSTQKMIEREIISELYLPIIVHDSGIPSMSSVSIFHVLVLDQNDNVSQPRNLYIQINYYGKYFPGGKVGNVMSEDLDVSNIFNCSIVTNSTTHFTITTDTCELQSGKQLFEKDFNLTVRANNGFHSPVSSNIYIKYKHFNNVTIDNSVLLLVRVSIREFLDKKYLHFVKTVDDLIRKNNTKLYVFGMMPMSRHVLLLAAIEKSNGQTLSRSTLIDIFTTHKQWLRTHTGITISAVTYDPCATNPCHHDAVCTKQISVNIDTLLLESSSVNFLSHSLMEPFNCICPNGYIGQLCELDIDECQAAPCSSYGTCLNYPGIFSCPCPEDKPGPLCGADRSECQQNLCQNGLTCLNLPRAFLCKCPPSYTGNLCQTIVNYCAMSHGHLNHGSCVNLPTEYNCSCPFRTSGNECDGSSLGFEELSYMELPSLDPTNNIIYVELATIRENSLLLYNYDNKEGADGEFLALEIINGKIEFSYNLGSGIVQLVTDQYVADGEFHKIFATRTGKVGSLTVDNCTNDQPAQFCFVSTPGIGTERTLDLEKNRMVFGGIKLIEPILLRPDQAKSHDFIGCIKEFRLNNIPVKFAEVLSSNNILTSCPRLGRMCQAKTCLNGGICLDRWSYYLCQCPEGFTGPHCEKDTAINFNGQFHLDYFIKESYKRDQLLNNHIKRKQNQKEDKDSVSIEIQFRTDSSEGILLHIQGSINYTTVKIMEGRINYISDASSVGYIKHRLNISISDSKWHTFKMESNDSVTTLMLDKKHIKSITHPTQRVGGIEISTLSLGQAPLLQFGNPNEQGFKGCIKIFKFNNHVMPFTGSNDLVEVRPRDSSVQIECRGPNVCLNNPCPTGMKGIDLWLAYECLLVSCFSDPCKHDSTCLPSSDGTYHCICKQDFTEFCTPTIIDHAACQKGNIQLPQWSIAVIILATLAVIPLIALFIKCLYITLKSKRTKIIASVQAVTEKMSDGHNDDVDNDLDNAGKQPDILKAENSYHIIDETYITATSMEQNKKSNGQGYDLEVNDIDNATSLTSSDFDVIKYHRQIQANNDHYNKAILHGSMQNKSQPFVAFVNQRNIQCLASQQSAVGHNPGPRNGFTNQQLTQMCSSEWFPSSVLFTERKHLINDLYLTDYETDHFQHGHFDSKKSSKGGIDNLAFCGDDQIESLPAASILMSSSRPSRRMIQIVERLPLGLSVEEIKRLNAPTIHKVVENTNQIISLSQIPQRPSAQKNHPGILPSTDTSSDSDSHSSFTCSEYNYERELPACSRSSVHKYAQQDSKRNIVEDEKMLNEREIGLEGHEKWYASDTCLIGTEIVTEEDSDNNMQPCDDSPVNKTHNWGDILNWGPRFEIYVEIFKDLAELPSEPGSENQFSTAGGSEHEEFL
ncbi:protocadherin Fat 4-like isoform X6 [Chiloscyllium punctatum]|uniref:protocadherin Fat 4-like isoform X6 n=1 Tax=Chiloscyllium punctatum TaxID=137246 RepID=UPI003B63C89D